MTARWNPWRALRAWGDRVVFELTDLGPDTHGLSYPLPGDRAGIEVSHRLGRVDRKAAAGHEVIHVEWRWWFTDDTPPHLVAKAEEAVERELHQRLVPQDELAMWVAMRSEFEPVTVAMICAEFDVPHAVAYRAASMLTKRWGTPAA